MKGFKYFLILLAICALYVFNPVLSEMLREFRNSHVANAIPEEMNPPVREVVEEFGVRQYSKEELQEIAHSIAVDEGVPTPVMTALIEAESAWEQLAFRMEPHLRGKVKHGDAGACSYGLTQVVYGFHAEACGLSNPVELYDPEIAVRCASKVLRECWSRAQGGSKERLRQSLRCYNGSGEKAEAYSKRVLAAVEEKLFAEVSL
jgi:hypothetical protein